MLFAHAKTSARRLLAIATTAIALLAMAAGPAVAADGGFASVGRGFKMAGDRERLAVVANVTKGAGGSGLSVGVELGSIETDSASVVSVVFQQRAARARSRLIKVDGFSMSFKAVRGVNCDYATPRLVCDRAGYDWVEGRAYRVLFVRGGQNAQGWLWTVRIKDLKTAKLTTLVSFRSPADQLGTGGEAGLYANPRDCSNITPVAGVVKKPSGAGTRVSWDSDVDRFSSCDGATMAAPVVKGSTRLRIR